MTMTNSCTALSQKTTRSHRHLVRRFEGHFRFFGGLDVENADNIFLSSFFLFFAQLSTFAILFSPLLQ